MNFLRSQPVAGGPLVQSLLDRVRRLVRLGDDRELRQVPAAALGIDAVRLMTVHGSKGLEFQVVHIPGMNAGTLPRSSPTPKCPPPDGMIEGGSGSAIELLKSSHEEEQACLFYVALSRARDRLFLYAPTKKSNGHRWALSSYLDRLGPEFGRQAVTPVRTLPPSPNEIAIELAIDGGLRFNSSQIGIYETCPRRFFYTHVLQVGGRRTATPYMKMHDAVRSIVHHIVGGQLDVTGPALELAVTNALRVQGLEEHGYHDAYKQISMEMVRYFVSIREGHTSETAAAVSLSIGAERIIVDPDDLTVSPAGERFFRRIETGHGTKEATKKIGAATFLWAVQQAFPAAKAELVYLADREAREISLSAIELGNRRDKLASFLRDIRNGQFPADPDTRRCPNCPAFFICGATPPGTLSKNF